MVSRFIEHSCDAAKAAFQRVLADDPLVASYTIDVVTRPGGRRRIHWQNALVRADDRTVGTASIGQFLDDGDRGTRMPAVPHAGSAVVALPRSLLDQPEGAALPFVRMVAEHCTQVAEEGGSRLSGPDAAERIRRLFHLGSND